MLEESKVMHGFLIATGSAPLIPVLLMVKCPRFCKQFLTGPDLTGGVHTGSTLVWEGFVEVSVEGSVGTSLAIKAKF